MTGELLRIIDANFNRSREALRVMEEYARFALEDQPATQALKSLRHQLTETVGRLLPAEKLLAARDTPTDVGTTLSTPTEQTRPDARAVFTAAAARLTESLRVLEEYVKVIDPEVAARFEACRYRCYELDKRLSFVGRRHQRLRRARLYVLVTASLCRGDWLETIRQVSGAGADLVQLREKHLDDGELLRRGQRAAEVCRHADTLFILNDRPDIARLCQADGLHLGQDDLPVSAVRRILGPDVLVGLSTHNRQQLDDAVSQQPDYLAVGPMFASDTKPQEQLAGPGFLAHAAGQTGLPLVAVGGINAGNLDQLQPGRPYCAAVCSAIVSQPDPAAATAELLSLLAPAPPTE